MLDARFRRNGPPVSPTRADLLSHSTSASETRISDTPPGSANICRSRIAAEAKRGVTPRAGDRQNERQLRRVSAPLSGLRVQQMAMVAEATIPNGLPTAHASDNSEPNPALAVVSAEVANPPGDNATAGAEDGAAASAPVAEPAAAVEAATEGGAPHVKAEVRNQALICSLLSPALPNAVADPRRSRERQCHEGRPCRWRPQAPRL